MMDDSTKKHKDSVISKRCIKIGYILYTAFALTLSTTFDPLSP